MDRSPCRVSVSFLGGWGLCAAVLLLGASLSAPVAAIEQHTAHGGPVKGLTVSPDGRWLVSTSFDYSAVLWSVPDFVERRRLIGHEAAVNTAAFSPDGRYLVTAGDDRTLRVWQVDELLDPAIEPIARVLEGHTAKVVDLAFSADGRWLLAVVEPEKSDEGEADAMPKFVTRSGYVEVEDVRRLVGQNGATAQQLWLLDLEKREKHELAFSGLTGIDVDPLAGLKAAQDIKAHDAENPRPLRVMGLAWHPQQAVAAVQLRAIDNKDRWLATIDFERSTVCRNFFRSTSRI